MDHKQLKEWRKRLGWSQKRAAESFGITLRAYQDREAGRVPIKRETAKSCGWDALYGDTDPYADPYTIPK